MTPHKKLSLIVGTSLALIILFAFFVRFYHIESIPAGIYPDEAANGVDALNALASGNFKLFYPANYGREGLFINIQALFIALIGNTITGLLIASVLFGTLSVLGMYLLAKELFHRSGAGLIASFMLATSYWAINFSRIGFRAIMTTFILTFSFYFFFRGFRTQRIRDFFLSGIIFGLGLHTYIAFRVAPLILVVLFPALIFSYENFLRRFWKHTLIFIFGAFISAAPMFYNFFISHPEDFESRSSQISVFSPLANGGNLWGTIGKTFALSLLKYNFWGDQNWRHNYPPYPVLDPVVGTFFLAGFLYLIWQTVTLIGKRLRDKDRDLRLVRNFFLLGSFFVMLLPEFLTNEGLPHALRSIGTQMPVFLMATMAAFWFAQKALRSQPGMKLALVSLLVISLSFSAVFNLTKYFVFFSQNVHAATAFNENYTNMARYLLALPESTQKYIMINEDGKNDFNKLPVYAHPFYYLTYQRVANMEIISPDTIIHHPSIFLMINYNDTIAQKMFERYPNAYKQHIDWNGPSREGGDFDVIVIPDEKK